MRRGGTLKAKLNKCAIGERPQKDESQEDSTHSLLGTDNHSIDINHTPYTWHPQRTYPNIRMHPVRTNHCRIDTMLNTQQVAQ